MLGIKLNYLKDFLLRNYTFKPREKSVNHIKLTLGKHRRWYLMQRFVGYRSFRARIRQQIWCNFHEPIEYTSKQIYLYFRGRYHYRSRIYMDTNTQIPYINFSSRTSSRFNLARFRFPLNLFSLTGRTVRRTASVAFAILCIWTTGRTEVGVPGAFSFLVSRNYIFLRRGS